jgi:hypothetical protein
VEPTTNIVTRFGRMYLENAKKFLPSMYLQMKSAGTLNEMAYKAQERAKEVKAELVEQGLNPDQAEEIVLNDYILLKPEKRLLNR